MLMLLRGGIALAEAVPCTLSPPLPAPALDERVSAWALMVPATRGAGVELLAELLREDEALAILSADLDGVGVEEQVLHARAPHDGAPPALWVLGASVNPALSVPLYPSMTLLGVDPLDVDGDGRPELVVSAEIRGGHTTTLQVQVFRVEDAGLRPLMNGDPIGGAPWAEMPSGSLTLSADEDLPALVLVGGRYHSAGAGQPAAQRDRQERWAWDGCSVTLQSTRYEPSDQRLHALQDGDRALQAGDRALAESLYRRVLEEPSLLDTPNVDGLSTQSDLKGFAGLRLAVLLAEEDRRALRALERRLNSERGSDYVSALRQFRRYLRRGASAAEACAELSAWASGGELDHTTLARLGYAVAPLTTASLCAPP